MCRGAETFRLRLNQRASIFCEMDASRPLAERVLHAVYSRAILPFVNTPLIRQRLKLIWFAGGYWPILASGSPLSLAQRTMLIARFLRIDWNVLHGHTPFEIASIVVVLSNSRPKRGGIFVEAGCWHGGSSAKFSFLCELMGLELHVYDSFQGVEDVSRVAGEWEYSGQYASPEETVRENLNKFGSKAPLSLYPGWFAETLAKTPPKGPVACAYIDCDIAKGTYEVLAGVLPSLASGATVFSQDYHIAPVTALLDSEATWQRLGVPVPTITPYDRRMVGLTWHGSALSQRSVSTDPTIA
jgi:O-methyltransferase